jgi:hypothetical protein
MPGYPPRAVLQFNTTSTIPKEDFGYYAVMFPGNTMGGPDNVTQGWLSPKFSKQAVNTKHKVWITSFSPGGGFDTSNYYLEGNIFFTLSGTNVLTLPFSFSTNTVSGNPLPFSVDLSPTVGQPTGPIDQAFQSYGVGPGGSNNADQGNTANAPDVLRVSYDNVAGYIAPWYLDNMVCDGIQLGANVIVSSGTQLGVLFFAFYAEPSTLENL